MPEPKRRKPNRKKADDAASAPDWEAMKQDAIEGLYRAGEILNAERAARVRAEAMLEAQRAAAARARAIAESRDRLARGVYALPFRTKQGYVQLVAVDSNGCEVTRANVFEGERECDVAGILEGVLDETDPIWTEESDA